MHHRIPTKSIIFPHVALSDQVCPCCNDLEKLIHVLCDCHFARHIWSSFPVHLLSLDFFNLELHDWCKLNSKLNSPSCYVPWNIIFAFTIWTIWLDRNSLIFSGKFIPFHILKQNAISHATEFFFLSTVPSRHSS